jgi:hypothetical protein
VPWKSPDWILGGNSTDLLSQIIAGEAFHFDANQTENLYDEDAVEYVRLAANQRLWTNAPIKGRPAP